MKRILLCLLALVCLSGSAFGQAFKKGDLVMDAGVNLGSAFAPRLALEYGVTDKVGPGYIGVGGETTLLFFSGFSTWLAGPFASYHFPIPKVKELDLFAGLGFYFGGYASGDYIKGAAYGPFFAWRLGGRYYFQPNLAGHLILGGSDGVGFGVGISFHL